MEKTFDDASNPYLSLARADVVILLLTAPFLLFPNLFPNPISGLALLILLVPFIVRLARGERLSRPTAANLPVAILGLVFLPMAFLASPSPWAITWIRVTNLAWSIALFFTIINSPSLGWGSSSRNRFIWPTQIYLAMGLLTALLGILGMRSVDKLFSLPQMGILAGWMGWGSGLPTNEIAGVLTLFIPFSALLAYGCWKVAGRRSRALLLLALTTLMLAAMVLAQSRTALVATIVATALALVLSGSIPRKRLAVGAIILVMGLLIIPLTPMWDWFVFAGANSWASVLGPRLGIWEQAVAGIRDHPLWGMGFGAFGSLARLVYPLISPEAAPVLEDAHNLYLQTALDLGLAGLVVFLAIGLIVAASAVRLMREWSPGTLGRLWAAGLLGSLMAHAIYSLTDAVSLGTLGGIPVWFLFGVIMSAPNPQTRLTWSKPGRILFGAALFVVVMGSVIAYPINRAGQLAIRSLVNPAGVSVENAEAIGRLADSNCRARWYEGLSYQIAGDPDGRAAAWGSLLACADDYTGYMSVLAAGDAELAQLAIETQPENAAGYFWLAEISVSEAPLEAIQLYRRGLVYAPEDGRRWLALAELLRSRDDAAALDAFLQACRNGDPGANGCLNAGLMAESRGDLAAAIEYLRLSNFSDALMKADELERQINQNP